MIETIRQGLKQDGFEVVAVSTVCKWFGIPRRTVYYKPLKAKSVIQIDLPNRSGRWFLKNRFSVTEQRQACWGSIRI